MSFKLTAVAIMSLKRLIAIETSGAIGSRSRAFLRELGRRVGAQTGEARSTSYLFQRLSVAIQRGNAAAVMGCAPRPG